MLTTTAKSAPKTRRRAASKEQRREQLIKATIRCIARRGLSGTTMADITGTAKLSQGIVNLHFQSKDKLLVETLRYVAEEYKRGWDSVGDDTTLSPTEKVLALIEHDFSKDIARSDKIAVWYAFWGESGSRPTYRSICQQTDLQTSQRLRAMCRELGASKKKAELVATGYTALVDGLWLDLLVSPEEVDHNLARTVCRSYWQAFFPDQFK